MGKVREVTGGLPNRWRAKYDTAQRRKTHRLVLNVLFIVVFVTGRGGAGFHPEAPPLHGPGGFFGGQSPPPPPSGASPRLFPGRGPVSHHLI